jgi:hypothetical protein
VDGRDVDALEGGLHAELLALASLVRDLTGVQKRLGGNAAVVQTGAPELVLLDQGDVEPQLRGTQSCCVAAAAAAEDH